MELIRVNDLSMDTEVNQAERDLIIKYAEQNSLKITKILIYKLAIEAHTEDDRVFQVRITSNVRTRRANNFYLNEVINGKRKRISFN